MKPVLVTADDFGLCDEVNQAVFLLHDRGVVDRTSVIVNGPAFESGLPELRRRPRLRTGIHLNMTDGAPVLPPERVPSLVGPDGRFPGGRHVRVLARLLAGRVRLDELREEWRAQIARARDAGLEIAHLNAHGHLHMLPMLHGVVADLLEESGIPCVRLVLAGGSLRGRVLAPCSRRLLGRLRARGIDASHPDRVLGLGHQGALTADALARLLTRRPPGVSELLVHPATADNDYHRRWSYAGTRELESLLSEDVAALLRS